MAPLIGNDEFGVERPGARDTLQPVTISGNSFAIDRPVRDSSSNVGAMAPGERAESVQLHFKQPTRGRERLAVKRRMHQLEMTDCFRDDDVARHEANMGLCQNGSTDGTLGKA